MHNKEPHPHALTIPDLCTAGNTFWVFSGELKSNFVIADPRSVKAAFYFLFRTQGNLLYEIVKMLPAAGLCIFYWDDRICSALHQTLNKWNYPVKLPRSSKFKRGRKNATRKGLTQECSLRPSNTKTTNMTDYKEKKYKAKGAEKYRRIN